MQSKLSLLYAVCMCLCSTDSEASNIDDCSSIEIVDEFCYLGDMLSVDGDVEAAVTARIRMGWFKFWSLASFLTSKDISVLL